jgi:hypothetical protein
MNDSRPETQPHGVCESDAYTGLRRRLTRRLEGLDPDELCVDRETLTAAIREPGGDAAVSETVARLGDRVEGRETMDG